MSDSKQPRKTNVGENSDAPEDPKKKRLAEALRRNLRQRKKASPAASGSSRTDGGEPDNR